MPEIISVSPFRCRMWSGHERLEEQISAETCRDEIASVASHGQLLPVLGRPLKADLTHDFELIFGSRRLFIARHLNVPLLLDLRDVSDREAMIALDMENRLRKDFSPYERGRSFNAWIRAGQFGSQEELAKVLNISPSQVSRLLNLSQLPTVLLNAFGSPTEICEAWGRDLLELWKDPNKRAAVTDGARAIGREHPRPPAAKVYQRLVLSPGVRNTHRRKYGDHDEIVKDNDGVPLFRVCIRRNNVAILLPAARTSAVTLSEIKQLVAGVLQRASSQPNETNRKYRIDNSYLLQTRHAGVSESASAKG